MTESIAWTRFNCHLIAEKLYETDTETNPETIVNDPDDNYRVVTKKDLRWKWNANEEYVYTNDEIRATKNAAGTDYILKIVGAGEPGTDDSFTGYDLTDLYGFLDVTYIVKDNLYTTSTRWLACSTSSGLWILTVTSGVLSVSHVANSPPCCFVLFDTYYNSSGYYLLLANNECYDEYTFSGSVITSKKLFTTTSRNIVKVVDFVNHTMTVSLDNGTTNLNVTHKTANRSHIGDSPGYKLITYYNNSSVVCYMNIGQGNSSAAIVATVWTSTSSSSGTYDLTTSEATGWGMIYYTNDKTFTSSWSDVSSQLSIQRCPSISSGGVGTNTGSSTDVMYYFGCDDKNDFILAWKLLAGNNLSHGTDGQSLGWSSRTLNIGVIYHERETTSITDDVWIMCSQLGILSMCGQSGGSYTSIQWSASSNSGSTPIAVTDYAFCKISSSVYEFAFDSVNEAIKGLYDLVNNWFQSKWSSSTYKICSFNDTSGSSISSANLPAFKKVIDNESLIYAISTGNGAGGYEGLYYAIPQSFSTGNTFNLIYTFPSGCKSVNLFIKGSDLVLILNDRMIILKQLGTATASTISSIVSSLEIESLLYVDEDGTPIITDINYAGTDGTNILTLDNKSFIGQFVSGTPATTSNTIIATGEITGPTITDINSKINIITSALGL